MDDWSSVEDFEVQDNLHEIYIDKHKGIYMKDPDTNWDRIEYCCMNNILYRWLKIQYRKFR